MPSPEIKQREMNTEILIDEYLTEGAYRVLAKSTMDQQRWALQRLLAQCPTLPCQPMDVMRAVGDVSLSAESRRDLMKCIRTFLRWAERRHGFPNPCSQLAPLPRPRHLPRVLTDAEVQRLLAAAETGRSAKTDRDRLLVLLLLDCGLRVGEVANMRAHHIGDGWISVDGKVGARQVPVSPHLLAELDELGDGHHIWVGQRGPLTRDGIVQAYKRMYRRAGIVGRKTGPHTLRHTFATLYLRAGGGVRQLQYIMGHAKIETTMLYVSLAGRDVQKDHNQHSPVRTLGLISDDDIG